MIRLGRISYVNMAPVFYRLEHEVEEVGGRPDRAEPALIAGELDLAPISSIEWARNADRLRILPRLCVSLGGRGRLDPARLARCRSSRCGAVAVTPESATSVVLTKVLLPEAEHVPLGEEADAKLLIGDAALKSAFEDPTPHYDLGRLWLERTGLPMVFAVFAAPEPVAPGMAALEDALVDSVRRARAEPEQLAYESSERYGYPAGFLARYFEKLRYRFGPRERAGLFTFLEMAARRRRARARCRSCASSHEEVPGVTRTELVEWLIERYPSCRRGGAEGGPAAHGDRVRRRLRSRDNLDGAVKPKSYFIFSFDQKPLAELGEAATRRPPEEIALTGGPHGLRRTIVSVRVNPASPYRVVGERPDARGPRGRRRRAPADAGLLPAHALERQDGDGDGADDPVGLPDLPDRASPLPVLRRQGGVPLLRHQPQLAPAQAGRAPVHGDQAGRGRARGARDHRRARRRGARTRTR